MLQLLTALLLFHVSTVWGQKCQYNLEASHYLQEFTSPKYPSKYGNNLNCVWMFTSPPTYQVEITFEDISTEEEYDTITIADGAGESAHSLATLSGESKENSSFISSGGMLRVSFRSDRSVGSRGFKAIYRIALQMQYNITSVVQTRLVETTVTSHVTNNDIVTREVPFVHIMPLDAVVSRFDVSTDDVQYTGMIELKRNAEADHGASSLRPATSIYTSANRERLKKFSVSLNIRSGGSAMFRFKYFRVLTRSQSRYVYRAMVERRQFVSNISVDIYICAPAPFRILRIRDIVSDNMRMLPDKEDPYPPGFSVTRKRNYAHISYRPPAVREVLPGDGEFQIQYNNQRNFKNGVFYVDKTYFTHIFSPKLLPIPRRIVFVLDISGSMAGLKIQQVRIAMSNILQNLDRRVFFNIVLFESVIRTWRQDAGLVRASKSSKASAKRYISRQKPDGATNINDALLAGLRLLRRGALNESPRRRTQVHPLLDYIVFLTDGQPTIGVRSSSAILRNVKRQNSRGYGILSIGFGENVDATFLKDLAGRNSGIWRQIFEDADAAIQIENFLSASLNAPLMIDFKLAYPDDIVEQSSSLTGTVLRRGSEFVVSGRLKPHADIRNGETVRVLVSGITDKPLRNASFNTLAQNIQRCSSESNVFARNNISELLYALTRINSLIEKVQTATTEEEKRPFREEAIDLSLSYSLVTNFTALVIEESPNTTPSIGPRLERPKFPPTLFPVTKEPLPWIFQGDPHFMMTLNHNLTICFTFAGSPGKIYNLINDPKLGIVVRGAIVTAPARPADEVSRVHCANKIPLTYFYTLAFSFTKKNIAFVVTPHNITMYNNTKKKFPTIITYPTSDNMIHLEDSNTKIVVYGVSKMHSYVNVTLRNVATFIVNLHRTRDALRLNHTKPREDHVDMDVVGAEQFSSQSDGIFGEFSLQKKYVATEKNRIVSKKNQNFLLYRNKRIEVQFTGMVDPLARHHKLKCWYTCEAERMLGKPANHFLSSSLLDTRFF